MYLRFSVKSVCLQKSMEVHALLPFGDGYPDTPAPWPTLYFLPGYSGNAEEILFALPLRKFSATHGIAVILSDGDNAFYTDHPERSACYRRFFGEELVAVSRRLMPGLSRRREDTFIGGISMGGYGACITGLSRPETFSRIAMLSPAIDPEDLLLGERPPLPGSIPPSVFGALFGSREAYHTAEFDPLIRLAEMKKEQIPMPRMYACCGTEDLLVKDAYDRFVNSLKEMDIPLTHEESPGIHDFLYWDTQIGRAFDFLRYSWKSGVE